MASIRGRALPSAAGWPSNLSVRAGDNLTLVSPRGAVTPFGTTPRIKAYKIAAVFEIGMSEYDAAFVFMPLAEAQAYFGRSGDVTAIEVYTDDPDHVDSFRKLVSDAAARPIYMLDWRQRNATFFNALQVERNVMFLILTLIVLVAALNIVSGLIMLVKDKGSDIAILRTMGATQGVDHARLSHHRIFDRRGRHLGRVSCSAPWSVSTSMRSGVSCPGLPIRICSRPSFISSRSCPLTWISRKPRPWWSWRSACRSLRPSIHPGGPRVSTRSKRFATNESPTMDDKTTITETTPPPAEEKEEEHPLIFLHGIGRQFHQGDSTLDVLKGAELAVWPGQSVALVAPSGAGKSTLLHIAGLLEHPDAGEVYIDTVATSQLTDHPAHPDPAQRYRLRLSVPSSVAGVLRAGERDAAADDPRPVARASDRARRRVVELFRDSRIVYPIARPNCRAASSSGSPSRVRSPMHRACSWPTNPPAISTSIPPSACSPRYPNWSAPRDLPRSLPRTTSILPRKWIAA